ncbi:MAG: HhH-GPD-type base excision DNA repair protein [Acidimicrobiales bacterium]
MPVRFTDPPGPEDLVNRDPLALLIAMLLDQQVPITWAFAGPARLAERLDGGLSAEVIAEMDPGDFVALAAAKPAMHRYPKAMAIRIQALCRTIVDDYGGDAGRVWHDIPDAREVRERLESLPGFGTEKAQITVAVLAKRFDLALVDLPAGAGPFADDQPRSVADIDGPASLALVKEWKKAQRAAGRSKADPTV